MVRRAPNQPQAPSVSSRGQQTNPTTGIEVPLTARVRRYGYIFWQKIEEDRVRDLLGQRTSIFVVFQGTPLGEKRIDWQYRRISVGWRHTRGGAVAATATVLRLAIGRSGELIVESV